MCVCVRLAPVVAIEPLIPNSKPYALRPNQKNLTKGSHKSNSNSYRTIPLQPRFIHVFTALVSENPPNGIHPLSLRLEKIRHSPEQVPR